MSKQIYKNGAVLIPAPPEFKILKSLKQRITKLEQENQQLKKQIHDINNHLSVIFYYLTLLFPEFSLTSDAPKNNNNNNDNKE